MVNVHGENKDYDYMIKFKEIIEQLKKFFVSRVMLGQDEHLLKLKIGLADSFDESVEFVLKG